MGITKAFMKYVQGSAAKYNGHCSWSFSQGLAPVSSIINGHEETKGGICEMLAARWIERHANGSSLASWLSVSGSLNSSDIDASKIRQLMQLFVVGTNMRTGMMKNQHSGRRNQTQSTILWLSNHGVAPMQTLNHSPTGVQFYDDDIRRANRNKSSKTAFVGEIATNIQRNLSSTYGNYALIGTFGRNGGHAMAAWVAQDVCFFDPNFGEFYFSSKASFLHWFPIFFRRALYSCPYFGICSCYELALFALKN